jgi:hypothetical protein
VKYLVVMAKPFVRKKNAGKLWKTRINLWTGYNHLSDY